MIWATASRQRLPARRVIHRHRDDRRVDVGILAQRRRSKDTSPKATSSSEMTLANTGRLTEMSGKDHGRPLARAGGGMVCLSKLSTARHRAPPR